MLALPQQVRIFIACGVTGMRKGFNGLVAWIEHDLQAGAWALELAPGRPHAMAMGQDSPRRSPIPLWGQCYRLTASADAYHRPGPHPVEKPRKTGQKTGQTTGQITGQITGHELTRYRFNYLI
jgi:hypothetical protein